jgi:anti-sigma factor RsiW
MKHISDDLIRKYLLGDGSESEREQVEISFLTDREFHQRVDIVETELIDAFVDDELSEKDTRKFLDLFATPERRQRIRIAATLKRGLANEGR